MANSSFTGFHPWHNQGATAIQEKRVRIANNNSTAIFLGDCVKRATAGVWTLATAGAGVSAVAQGASYWDATINGRRENPYLPASTTYSATVFDDHGETDQSFIKIAADPVGTRYVCQYSASTPSTSDITLNANLLVAAGSTTTGISGHTLDQSTILSTAALDFAIMDILHRVTNDTTVASAKAVVQINVGLVPPFNSAGTIGL